MPFLPIEYLELPTARAKKVCRQHYLEKRRNISNETRLLLDHSLRINTLQLPCFVTADTVLAFYPVSGEPNILPIVESAREMGKQVAFPICDPASCTITFHVASCDELVPSTYGIPEPSKDAPAVTDFSNCFCIVPGVVFDQYGYRIGYGKGYYDRFLENYNGFTAGLVYHDLLLETLPHEPTDMRVSIIVTERGVFLPDEKEQP